MAAGLAALALIALIAYKVLVGAHRAFSEFGIPFVWHSAWDANKGLFGAAPGLFGTAVTSAIALLIATPLALAIALFLSELAPRGVNTIVSSLVEMLAAIPSVVLGLWGILVLGPFLAAHVEPWLHRNLGFIPLFSGTPASSGILIAGVVLAIMVVPIVARVCRELFLSVPRDVKEASLGLGATRWEMVRGVVLSSSWSGIAAAIILGLGRALGEAIAVTQVIGNFIPLRHTLFAPGDTIASRVANQYQGAISDIQVSSLIYLAFILLVITFTANLVAQRIVKRFEFQRTGAS